MLALTHGELRLVELRQRQVARAGNVLARMLVGFADVDQNRAVVEQRAGPLRGDGLAASCSSILVFVACLAPGGRTGRAGWQNSSSTRGSAMRYQTVCASRREATRPSSRILARCCDSADWRQADRLGERADAGFAPLDQLAQDHQPALVGERAQDVGDLGGLALERGRIQHFGVASVVRNGDPHRKLAIANLVISNIYVKQQTTRRGELPCRPSPTSEAFFDEPTNTGQLSGLRSGDHARRP